MRNLDLQSGAVGYAHIQEPTEGPLSPRSVLSLPHVHVSLLPGGSKVVLLVRRLRGLAHGNSVVIK